MVVERVVRGFGGRPCCLGMVGRRSCRDGLGGLESMRGGVWRDGVGGLLLVLGCVVWLGWVSVVPEWREVAGA